MRCSACFTQQSEYDQLRETVQGFLAHMSHEQNRLFKHFGNPSKKTCEKQTVVSPQQEVRATPRAGTGRIAQGLVWPHCSVHGASVLLNQFSSI